MKRTAIVFSILSLVAASALPAQSSSTSDNQSAPAVKTDKADKAARKAEAHLKPFSAFAVGGGISLMGVNMQVATNLDRHLNLRGTGNFFTYNVNNITVNGNNGSNGVNVSGNVNFATGGVSLDYYPFPKHGFRLSPGALLYNQNTISATGTLAGGNSFTLNSQKYLSNPTNPLSLAANLGLNTHKQAFTMTTGFGNMIPRKRGGHVSFPFEIGAAFTGAPSLAMTLNGQACPTTNGTTCSSGYVNMGGPTADPTVTSNLNAQIAKYRNDLNPLQVYPIFSFGIAYDFHSSK